MFEILAKGGPVIIPLLLCSLAAVTVVVERALFFHSLGKRQRELLAALEGRLEGNDFPGALVECQRCPSPLAAVVSTILQPRVSANPGHGILAGNALRAGGHWALAAVFGEATRQLERFLPVLDTVVTMAPLLGLLGTVTGIIRSFGILSVSGIGHPTAVTGGVAEALIATGVGLAIAIFSLLFLNLYQVKAEEARAQMETYAQRLLGWVEAQA